LFWLASWKEWKWVSLDFFSWWHCHWPFFHLIDLFNIRHAFKLIQFHNLNLLLHLLNFFVQVIRFIHLVNLLVFQLYQALQYICIVLRQRSHFFVQLFIIILYCNVF
jgi:hypothetical protein